MISKYLVSGSTKVGFRAYLVTCASLIRMHLASIFLSSSVFPGCSILILCIVSLVSGGLLVCSKLLSSSK